MKKNLTRNTMKTFKRNLDIQFKNDKFKKIYNEERELIAIGKLNNPLKKDNSISRTIVFGIDF